MKFFLISLFIMTFFNSLANSICHNNFVIQSDSNKLVKHYIHPKSKFLGINSGFGFTSTIINDNNNYLTNGYVTGNNTYVFGLAYSHGLERNISLELAFNSMKIGFIISPNHDKLMSYYREMYRSTDFQFGGIYRLTTKNEFNIINFHGGLTLGFLRQPKHSISSYQNGDLIGTYTFNQEQQIITRIYLNDYNKFILGFYLGVSKDIRLSKDVRFFVSYQQRFGINPLIDGMISFEENNNILPSEGHILVRGGGTFLTGGFKILLFGKYLN
jgi:hypothetical protein